MTSQPEEMELFCYEAMSSPQLSPSNEAVEDADSAMSETKVDVDDVMSDSLYSVDPRKLLQESEALLEMLNNNDESRGAKPVQIVIDKQNAAFAEQEQTTLEQAIQELVAPEQSKIEQTTQKQTTLEQTTTEQTTQEQSNQERVTHSVENQDLSFKQTSAENALTQAESAAGPRESTGAATLEACDVVSDECLATLNCDVPLVEQIQAMRDNRELDVERLRKHVTALENPVRSEVEDRYRKFKNKRKKMEEASEVAKLASLENTRDALKAEVDDSVKPVTSDNDTSFPVDEFNLNLTATATLRTETDDNSKTSDVIDKMLSDNNNYDVIPQQQQQQSPSNEDSAFQEKNNLMEDQQSVNNDSQSTTDPVVTSVTSESLPDEQKKIDDSKESVTNDHVTAEVVEMEADDSNVAPPGDENMVDEGDEAFVWSDYLEATGAQAVSHDAFQHVSGQPLAISSTVILIIITFAICLLYILSDLGHNQFGKLLPARSCVRGALDRRNGLFSLVRASCCRVWSVSRPQLHR